MKWHKIPAFVFIFLLFFSCRSKRNKPQEDISKHRAVANDFVYAVGQLSFRRSFADIQFMKDEKEIGKYLEEQEKSNPILMAPLKDSSLLRHLESLGLVKGDELLLKKFILDSNNNLQTLRKETAPILFQVDGTPLSNQKLMFTKGQDSISVPLPEFTENIYYLLLNPKLSGDKALAVVSESYVMNGYNFDLTFFAIKF